MNAVRRWSSASSAILAGLFVWGCDSAEPVAPGQPSLPIVNAGSIAPPPASGSMLAGSGGAGGVTPVAGSAGATPMSPIVQQMPAGAGGSSGAPAMPPTTTPFVAAIRVPGVMPGEEGTVCTQVRLDNEAAKIVEMHNTLSRGSHHFIVSRVTDPTEAEYPVTPCTPFRGAVRGAPFTITQKHDDEVTLPAGVAYSIDADQLMHLELHYLNVGTMPIDVVAETRLFPASGSGALQEATVMLIGTGDILIAPREMASTGPKFIALPPGMEGAKFFAMTGHTHRFGTSVKVSAAGSTGQPITLLYDPQPYHWDSPEMKHLEPMVEVPAGGGFSFECSWINESDAMITFGESALAEMCFFWAYYYPKKPVTNVLLDGLDLGIFLGAL